MLTRSVLNSLSPAPPVRLYDVGQIDHIGYDADDNDDDVEDGLGVSKPKYHKSEKILGRLFRAIDEQKIWSENIQRRVDVTGPSVWEQLMGRIVAEMNQYGISVRLQDHLARAGEIQTM